MTKTIMGFFDSMTDAQKAQAELLTMGLSSGDIHILSGNRLDNSMSMSSGLGTDSNPTLGTHAGSGIKMDSDMSSNPYSSTYSSNSLSDSSSRDDMSFGQKIKNFFSSWGDWNDSDDVHYYAEGVRRGGVTICVDADENRIDEVSSILTRNGAVDIDRRMQFFKDTGFSKYDFNAAPYDENESLSYRQSYTDWERDRFDDVSIPVVEEKVNISKRAVEKGRVRILTRVIETPVNEDVRLRDERIEVERVPVDRPLQASDMSAFKDGEIELRETSEEAVVNKEARVIEEVRVRKQADERVETIHETAKRTDVDVDRTDSLSRVDSKRPSQDRFNNPGMPLNP